MYDKSIFARNLSRQMQISKESQVDIARLLGVSKSTVSAYCNGTQIPRMDKVEKLATHFGVMKSDLIEDPDKKPTGKADGRSIQDITSEEVRSLSTEELACLIAVLAEELARRRTEDQAR